MGNAAYKVPGGKLIKVSLIEGNGRIQEIKITGDFFLHPEDSIEDLERALVGRLLQTTKLANIIEELMEEKKAIFLGASPEDFEKCILMARVKNA
jgi:lipoate-protein ligase A